MSHVELQKLLNHQLQTPAEADSYRRAVWVALASAEPELAAEILGLFATVDAAAVWVTTPSTDAQTSPAQRIVAGQAEQIREALRKTAHGFAG